MVKWEVQLSGDALDLKELSKSLVDDELRVLGRDGQYFLESNRFESLINSKEVASLAADILKVLTGAVRLSIGGRTPLQVVNTAMISPDGCKDVFVTVSDRVHVRATMSIEIARSDGTKEVFHPAHSIPLWIKVALTDQNVAKALRLFGTDEHNWVSLYRLYEVIVGDIGDSEKIVSKGWATKSSIRRFKRTANSPSAVGDDSRHGKESSTPPPDPLDIGEAKALVEFILHNWLRSKV
ncbi:MAG: hypothetical protein E3K38_12990 [Candidatus Kuenenia stuttgartiensis]|nr:hypothetical protein [Candidatus Kuenenia stuttgartiensis]